MYDAQLTYRPVQNDHELVLFTVPQDLVDETRITSTPG